MHFAEIGVYRELYDLIAFVAIAYVVLTAIAAARLRLLSVPAFIAAVALAIPWLTHPVASYFVPASRIPQVQFARNAAARVLLLPPFQPYTFQGRGSGYDPDLFVHPGEAVPLNSFYPEYPVDKALALAESNDFRYARALGVAQVARRPYLQQNNDALKYQLAGVPRQTRGRHRTGEFIPLLSVTAVPHLVSIGDSPTENSVFFGDLKSQSRRVFTFRAGVTNIDPRAGWIDVRLAVPADPQWGSPFGGVYSESPTAWLATLPGTSILARTTGEIRDDYNRVVAHKTPSYKWWRLPAHARRLRCLGTCAVLLSAVVPIGLPGHHQLQSFTALPIQAVLPWFYTTELPPRTSGYLRFSERFDKHWVAIVGRQMLQPQRLDTALTGWMLPVSTHGATVYIVQTVALLQALTEVLALVGLAVLTVVLMNPKKEHW